MKKINILTNNSCPNSVAFNAPLFATKKLFYNKGFNLRFYSQISETIFESDILYVNSNFFRSFWRERKDEIFLFLTKSQDAGQQIIWFDTTDSTWCTQFEVLPYVDKFLKGQILKDKKLYLKPFKTGRIFTDAFNDLYNSKEDEVDYPPPDERYLDKIDISWNTCFENYSEARYSYTNKVRRKMADLMPNYSSKSFNVNFAPVRGHRDIPISCRVGLSHSRQSVIDHRVAINNLLHNRGVSTDKVSLPDYFTELRHSQIGVGPFGVGEITLRDFEIIICGALLLKPDMSHMETWPNLFIDRETCITHKWDLSDFNEKIDYCLFNKEKREEIVNNAQEVYKHALSDDGMNEFVERLVKYIAL